MAVSSASFLYGATIAAPVSCSVSSYQCFLK
nr:MAG TPA: hypothetical protein [Caudoviricetes sp.]